MVVSASGIAVRCCGECAGTGGSPVVHAGLRGAGQLFGLAGGLVVGISDSTAGTATRGLAAAAIVLSWLLLHTAFAQIYAREYASEGGLDFPSCADPQLTEFLYFATTIGTSFAVSDVAVTTRAMRRRVVMHSLVSFFFNAALIAIAIDWIKS